jgi:sirohydrochlorin cobaltochelatase
LGGWFCDDKVFDNEVQMQAPPTRGTILLAHGSRDPQWRKPIEAVADRLRSIAPMTHVRCAYMELMPPDLPASVDELATLGVTSVTVLPLFFGMGKHAREDLPLLMATLQVRHPNLVFDLRPAVGEETQVIELIARIALS